MRAKGIVFLASKNAAEAVKNAMLAKVNGAR